MQSAVTQKPVQEKSNSSKVTHVTEVKPKSANDLGAEAGMPMFMQRTPAPVAAAPPDIQRLCDACEKELVEDSAQVQPKLSIGAPNDEYEQEADKVSASVMRLARSGAPSFESKHTPTVHAKGSEHPPIRRKCSTCNNRLEEPLIQRLCTECAMQEEENDHKHVQCKPKRFSQQNDLAFVQRLVGSPDPGNALDPDIQSQSETVLNADLSGVRVHPDAAAQKAANHINARAFTHGNHIYLGAGQSSRDLGLMAHELTHTVQQGGSPSLNHEPSGDNKKESKSLLRLSSNNQAPDIQKLDWPDVDIPSPGEMWDAAGDAYDAGTEMASEAYDAASDAAGAAYDTVSDAAGDAYDTVSDAAGDAYDVVSDAASDVYDAASDTVDDAVDWMATQAGSLARRLVTMLGGTIRITSSGIEVIVPRKCLDPLPLKHQFDDITREVSVPLFKLPVAPAVTIDGEVGIAGTISPELQLQLGPLCLTGVRILINPLTASASISGGVSFTSAVSLGAEMRGGLTALLSVSTYVPAPPIIVPITFPMVGLEGGIAGVLRGIGAQTTTLGGSLSLSGSRINIGNSLDLDLGLGADLFLGAYAQLSLLGEHICRIYWEPYEWHGGVGVSLGLSGGMSIIPGLPTIVAPRINTPTLSAIPFDQFPLVIDRSGFSDDCPIKDKICDFMDRYNLFPTRLGGNWDWLGSYGPGPKLIGPLEVWLRDPSRASGAVCRGACGADCDTCEHHPVYRFTDSARGETWEYINFQICNSHPGCREHDAGFDWAADVHGEIGRGAMIMPWHMAANLECACTYPAGNCVAWVSGLPPYDRTMYFADQVRRITGGSGGGPPGGTPGQTPGGDDDDLGILRNQTAMAICKCVGDAKCGGGVIYKKCFIVSDKVCKNKGQLQKEADSLCNNTPEMKKKCKRPKCYYRHTDAKCPVKDSECGDGSFSASVSRDGDTTAEAGGNDHDAMRSVPMLPIDVERKVVGYIEEGRYTEALAAAVSGLNIDSNLSYFLYAARSDAGEGLTTTDYNLDSSTGLYVPSGRSKVEIYTPAFASASWLVSTIMHEYQHVLQHQKSLTGTELSDPTGEHNEAGEVDAYLWEIEHAIDTGMATDLPRLLDTWSRTRQHYAMLGNINPLRQAQYRQRYEAAETFMEDIQTSAPPLPSYQHVYHHGTDYDTAQTVYTSDIDARGDIDFGLGFYTHTKENWHLAKEWALRRAVGTRNRGWGVITFPIPDDIWNAHINNRLTYDSTTDRPGNAPINPRTGHPMNWRQFVRYNYHERENAGETPSWGDDYDVISGPLYGRRYENTDIRQMMFTSGGTPVLNLPLVKQLRILISKLFRRRRR